MHHDDLFKDSNYDVYKYDLGSHESHSPVPARFHKSTDNATFDASRVRVGQRQTCSIS